MSDERIFNRPALLPAGHVDPFFPVGFVNRWAGERTTKDGRPDGNEIHVWCVIENPADGVDTWDALDEELGEIPWWWNEYTDLGLTYVVTDGNARRDHNATITWMLLHGIAPGQPFLVQFTRPTFSVDYFGEHDMDWSCGVVAVRPWVKTSVLIKWKSTFKRYGLTVPLLVPK